MAQEIERKYLVTSDSYRQKAIARYHIIQGYISREKTGTVRIRITDDKAYLTIKGKPLEGHLARYEWEKEIAVDDAKELIKLCQGSIIEKTRWIIPASNGLKWEIDEFHGKHNGLVLAEIELQDEEQLYDKPDFIGEDVTADSRYYNSNM